MIHEATPGRLTHTLTHRAPRHTGRRPGRRGAMGRALNSVHQSAVATGSSYISIVSYRYSSSSSFIFYYQKEWGFSLPATPPHSSTLKDGCSPENCCSGPLPAVHFMRYLSPERRLKAGSGSEDDSSRSSWPSAEGRRECSPSEQRTKKNPRRSALVKVHKNGLRLPEVFFSQ